MYLYKFLNFEINCNFLIPKLLKYIGQFSHEQICTANQALWSSLIYFYANILGVVVLVLGLNWKSRGTPPDFFQNFDIKRGIVFHFRRVIWLVFAFILTLIYIFRDLNFQKFSFLHSSVLDLPTYSWQQIDRLHLGIGLISFIGVACFLVPFFTRAEDWIFASACVSPRRYAHWIFARAMFLRPFTLTSSISTIECNNS